MTDLIMKMLSGKRIVVLAILLPNRFHTQRLLCFPSAGLKRQLIESRGNVLAEINTPDFDAGYWQNARLGRVVIGGLLMATFFTLLFVPWGYAIDDGRETA